MVASTGLFLALIALSKIVSSFNKGSSAILPTLTSSTSGLSLPAIEPATGCTEGDALFDCKADASDTDVSTLLFGGGADDNVGIEVETIESICSILDTGV